MESGRIRTAVALAAALAAGAAWAAEAGRIESVTVYRGQAEVVRVVETPARTGAMEIVVTDLPEQIVPDSLYVHGGEGVRIRAVRYRTRAVAEAPRGDVRQIERDLHELDVQLLEVRRRLSVVGQKDGFLDKLEAFSSEKARTEKADLDADVLKKLTRFVFEQREELAQERLKLEKEERALAEKASLLQRERAELTHTTSRTAREAVVFIEKAKADPVPVRLGYLVGGVAWTPTYNIRVSEGADTLELEYNAAIQQTSGEDWTDVQITLSTATPTLAADAPQLSPFWVTLTSAGRDVRDILGLETALRRAEESFRAAQDDALRREAESIANTAAADANVLTFEGREELARRLRSRALAVTYPLDDRQSVRSRRDRQTLRIASLKLPGTFYHLAVPILTRYVYRQALATNRSKLVFLQGRASAYVDGRFAGTGLVPLARPRQRFLVGLGVNSRLTARQELEDRQERIIGGNKEQTYTYRLLLENFGDRPVAVRLLDRIPLTRDGEISVELLKTERPLSTDPAYVKTQRPDNILRWDMTVPAGAREARALSVGYSFRLKYDRSMQVSPGRSTTPLFLVLKPREAWVVEEGWSRDRTKLDWQPAAAGKAELLTVSLERGGDGKNVIGRRVEGDLSGYRWLVLELDSRMQTGTRVAVGLSTGKDWTYYESGARHVAAGESPKVAFDLTAPTFKSRATNWEYRARPGTLDDVRALYILFYPRAAGTVNVRNITLAK